MRALAIAGLLMALAGCGADGDPTRPGEETGQTTEAAQ